MLHTIWIWFLQCLGFDPRGIFSFHDGRRWRHVDPMVIARNLAAISIKEKPMPGMANLPGFVMVVKEKAFDAAEFRAMIGSGEESQIQEAYFQITKAVRQAFNVRELEQGGLTELECDALLERFDDYLGYVKKNGSGLPTTFPYANPPLTQSSAGKPSSDSLETETGSHSAAPGSSVSA
jgi:hypothetical protein